MDGLTVAVEENVAVGAALTTSTEKDMTPLPLESMVRKEFSLSMIAPFTMWIRPYNQNIIIKTSLKAKAFRLI